MNQGLQGMLGEWPVASVRLRVLRFYTLILKASWGGGWRHHGGRKNKKERLQRAQRDGQPL